MFIKVEEGYQAVIYRLGRFYSLAGPGMVWLWPYLDEVHAMLDVRSARVPIVIRTFAGGVPVTLRLSFHARLDLQQAAANDLNRLAELASWDEQQRKDKLDDAVQNLVVRMVKEYERRHPVSADADVFDRLAHIITMTRENDALMTNIRRYLGRVIAQFGYVLGETEPCWMVLDSLPPSLLEAFDRVRTERVHMQRLTEKWRQILQLIHDYPPHLQAHLLAVVEGLEPPPIQIPGGEGAAEVNARVIPGGGPEIEITPRPKPTGGQRSTPQTARGPLNAEDDPDPPLTLDEVASVQTVPLRQRAA
ncbi:MAG: SPFH domain-containing protein [Anaerolineae bacterium]|nr:SPFH domain-containing protein [Caldilineales bacterium]MDW8268347.1 SPFH domain-containing protein [Anaerolineae bacterium]